MMLMNTATIAVKCGSKPTVFVGHSGTVLHIEAFRNVVLDQISQFY